MFFKFPLEKLSVPHVLSQSNFCFHLRMIYLTHLYIEISFALYYISFSFGRPRITTGYNSQKARFSVQLDIPESMTRLDYRRG